MMNKIMIISAALLMAGTGQANSPVVDLVLAFAGNPSGTGLPSQSCQDIEAAGGTTPGGSAQSPGSPFNEPGINSTNGGTGGQHYNETSQYDVACFQVSGH
jgi:hypothetical protein